MECRKTGPGMMECDGPDEGVVSQVYTYAKTC